MTETVTHRRSPERAAAVLDRAASMRKGKPRFWDQRLFDRQMRTPGAGQAPINFDYLKPEHVIPHGTQTVSTRAIVSDQPTVSLKAVKGKIAQTASGGATPTSGGKLPQLLLHNGQYHVFDGNHRVTAARALGDRAVTGQVFELKPGVGRPSAHNSDGLTLGIAGAASIASVAAAAKIAHRDAKAAGASDSMAATKATMAGVQQASTPLVLSSMIGAAERYGPRAIGAAASTFGKLVLPASMAGHAAAYAWDAYKHGADGTGIAKAAGWGAVNGVIPIDLMNKAFGPASRDPSAAFNAANQHYAQLHMTHAPEGPKAPDGERNTKRGTQNEANLKAIIAARQQRAAERTK